MENNGTSGRGRHRWASRSLCGQSTQTLDKRNLDILIFQNDLSLQGNSQLSEVKILFFPLPKLHCFPVTCNLTHPSSTATSFLLTLGTVGFSLFYFHLMMLNTAHGELQTQLQVTINPAKPGSECELFPC